MKNINKVSEIPCSYSEAARVLKDGGRLPPKTSPATTRCFYIPCARNFPTPPLPHCQLCVCTAVTERDSVNDAFICFHSLFVFIHKFYNMKDSKSFIRAESYQSQGGRGFDNLGGGGGSYSYIHVQTPEKQRFAHPCFNTGFVQPDSGAKFDEFYRMDNGV